MKKIKWFLIMMGLPLSLLAQKEVPLYEGQIPNAKDVPDRERHETVSNGIRIARVSVPTLTIFVPAGIRTGTSVVICPGGGYIREAMNHEGYDVARKFNETGVTAFVLKYRLPSDTTMNDKSIGPLQDAQRAIQWVREHAREYHIDTHKVGIIGFSAGGHLASTAATHFETQLIPKKHKISVRPDFVILGYPVINLSDSLMHEGSRTNLLGKRPSEEMITKFSNDLQVTRKTPPVFIFHAQDDKTVNVRNSIRFYEALQAHHVPSRIYLFEKGGHGFGMHNPTSDVQWVDLAEEWMRSLHML
jgi:acetyl esterase/lipase